ncbi:iron-hydroxamate ABC transporter substrate-binding protein [Sporolactobacillus inulinus]|uniref:ABC transporter substrate-binding protein n=1 Tax=Sporolactobacillus inulinus CASD TaxID=1069536 RepID=A0A0U1QKT2_9BACL|nr:iron-hydroxamate ABC transporter substrate-binding protein [Sporolactobacillus inulinus]KLI01417.1 ABC transporter substrate-binding protein [Sporolactobacillus inulinus CASD]GEB77902.1 ferrichrome ABC transporter substrate-binding protein [Sporolactobacillus inulinus]
MIYIKKAAVTFASVLLILSLLAGCSTANDASDNNTSSVPKTRVAKDAMGHNVKVPTKPKRILASYLEDNLVALGVKPVAQWSINNGKGVQDYLQKDLKAVPTVPSDLPYEAVASFKPDLILIDSAGAVSGGKYAQYQKIAPTYVLNKDVNGDWRDKLLQVGTVLGKKEQAEKVLADYDAKAKKAKQTVKNAVGTPTVAAIWLTGNKFFVVGDNVSSGAVLYQDLGLKAPQVVQEISKSATANWSTISLEKLAKLDTDYLFLINSDKSSGATMLKDSVWKNIPAVKNHHVFEYGADASWLYSGPNANSQIIDGVLKNMTQSK